MRCFAVAQSLDVFDDKTNRCDERVFAALGSQPIERGTDIGSPPRLVRNRRRLKGEFMRMRPGPFFAVATVARNSSGYESFQLRMRSGMPCALKMIGTMALTAAGNFGNASLTRSTNDSR